MSSLARFNNQQDCTHLAVYTVFEQATGHRAGTQVQSGTEWDLSELHPTTGGTVGLRRMTNPVLVTQLTDILKKRNPTANFDEEAFEAFRKRLLGHLSERKELASFGIHVPIADGLTLGVDIVKLAPSSCSPLAEYEITAGSTCVQVPSDSFRYDPVVFGTSSHPTIVPVTALKKAKVWKKGSFRVCGQSKDLSAADAISHFVTQIEEWAANPRREAEVSVDYTRFTTEGDEGTAFRLTFECSDAECLPRITTINDLLCD